jgi:hypothetical protein
MAASSTSFINSSKLTEMSYRPIILYGYEIIVLYDMDLPHTINMIYDLNSTIKAPFEMKCLIPCFPTAVNESQIKESMVQLIIGFTPSSAQETYQRSQELETYLNENLFNDFAVINRSAGFYSGMEWRPTIESDESSVSESESELEEIEPMSDDDSILSHSPVYPKYFS